MSEPILTICLKFDAAKAIDFIKKIDLETMTDDELFKLCKTLGNKYLEIDREFLLRKENKNKGQTINKLV